MLPELPGAVPEMPVSDLIAATEYYRDRLGFTVDWVEPDLALAGVSRDQCRLFLFATPEREHTEAAAPWHQTHLASDEALKPTKARSIPVRRHRSRPAPQSTVAAP